MGFQIEASGYMSSGILGGKSTQGTVNTSAFAGRKEQSMDEALQANSIHVAAGAAAAKSSPVE